VAKRAAAIKAAEAAVGEVDQRINW
jgi:hypothetical protein